MTKPVKGKVFPVMCLVAGTCVGGGMLALPVATSLSGLFPSLIMMAITGAFMAITGLLFVEANLWMEKGAHFLTMSSKLLGPFGRLVVAILFLFIAYASLVAYTAGGAEIFQLASRQLFDFELGRAAGCILFSVIFCVILLLGRWIIGRVNAVLFIGMCVAYILLLLGGLPRVGGIMLLRQNWSHGIYALPLLLTIFSYQAIVPSLVIHLDRDFKALRKAIIGGVVIAFFIYAIWLALFFGVVPLTGEHGLLEAYRQGMSATQAFRHHVGLGWIAAVAEFFAFFALVTSFLGIGLGLYDFLADSLHVRKRVGHRFGLVLLIGIPSVAFAIGYSRAFLVALDTTGGFGDSILNGMIPVFMVWSGRYLKEYNTRSRVGGGKTLLIILVLFALLVLGVELAERIQFLTPVDDLR